MSSEQIVFTSFGLSEQWLRDGLKEDHLRMVEQLKAGGVRLTQSPPARRQSPES